MNLIVRIAVALFAIATLWASPIAQAADSTIVGSWRLLSWVEVETETKAVRAAFGDDPVGVLTYTPDGRMSIFIANPKRKAPAGPKATDAEATDLYRTMVAYAGTYSVDGDTVTHKIEVSWNQTWSGTSQKRQIEIKEDHLTIKTPPIISPSSGKESVHTLVWERIK
jgi:lipocalin-like protein